MKVKSGRFVEIYSEVFVVLNNREWLVVDGEIESREQWAIVNTSAFTDVEAHVPLYSPFLE